MLSTPIGDRTLDGAERRLIGNAIRCLFDILYDCDDLESWISGLGPFVQLPQHDKCQVLLSIAEGCLTGAPHHVKKPKAYYDAALAAVYQFILTEVDDPGTGNWRELVQAAHAEKFPRFSEEEPYESLDRGGWIALVEEDLQPLVVDEERIEFMHDTYVMMPSGEMTLIHRGLLDDHPLRAKEILEHYSLPRDYLTASPPPLAVSLEELQQSLASIVGD